MRWSVGVVIVGLATPAAAGTPETEPFQQFVGGGLALGISNSGEDGNHPSFQTLNFGAAFELGQRIADVDTPLFVHEQITAGVAGQVFGGSSYFVLARVGLEARSCGIAQCGVFGIDVGYQHDGPSSGALDTVRLVPRIGLDVGGTTVRFRPSVDVSLGIPGAFSTSTAAVFLDLAVAWQGT